MSLIYGFNANEHNTVAESNIKIKTFSAALTLKNYNELRTVSVFNSSIVLLGISTTSTHSGVVYYDIYNSGRTVLIERVQAYNASRFSIHDESTPNTMTKLRKAYTLNGACSITMKMGLDSDASVQPLRDPLTVNIVLHYIEIPNKYTI